MSGAASPEVTVTEVSPDRFEQLNAMCVPHGPEAPDILSARRESAEALQRGCAMGLRVFGAFLGSEPVGRLELSPVDAAPVPLTGQGVWVIRCIWVLNKAKGLGLGRRLLRLALDSVGAEPVAVLTYDDWMPPAFFEKYGFVQAQREGEAILMVRPGGPSALGRARPEGCARGEAAGGGAARGGMARGESTPGTHCPEDSSRGTNSESSAVSFVPVKPSFELSPGYVRVDAVYTPRCPWRIATIRRRLGAARELSDRVVAEEHPLENREDALRFGEEHFYVEGEPLAGGPIAREAFLQAVTERLRAKGLILSSEA